jgi:hypothetical protein
MNAPSPYDHVYLAGNGITRGVTLTLPTARVTGLLPYGLDLGEQDLTPPGTHPVVLFFHDMFRAHLTIPTLLPDLTYHEQTLGIPFSYVTRGLPRGGACGPFFFMARLFLDDVLATAGGILWWGFAKKRARVTVTGDRYTVSGLDGDPRISLHFDPVGEYRPIADLPAFEPIRRVMCQPIVSRVPAAMGPWFVCSDFDRKWDEAGVRPLRTVVRVDRAYVPGLPCGRFPARGRAVGIDRSPLGSYELSARWRLSLPYPYLTHWHPRDG